VAAGGGGGMPACAHPGRPGRMHAAAMHFPCRPSPSPVALVAAAAPAAMEITSGPPRSLRLHIYPLEWHMQVSTQRFSHQNVAGCSTSFRACGGCSCQAPPSYCICAVLRHACRTEPVGRLPCATSMPAQHSTGGLFLFSKPDAEA
jgi:hypothetical protein